MMRYSAQIHCLRKQECKSKGKMCRYIPWQGEPVLVVGAQATSADMLATAVS